MRADRDACNASEAIAAIAKDAKVGGGANAESAATSSAPAQMAACTAPGTESTSRGS